MNTEFTVPGFQGIESQPESRFAVDSELGKAAPEFRVEGRSLEAGDKHTYGATDPVAGSASIEGRVDLPSSLDIFGHSGENLRQKVDRVFEELRTGKLDPNDPAAPWKLLSLQMAVQDMGFQIEIASKVVEHATSAAKTVLQTQA